MILIATYLTIAAFLPIIAAGIAKAGGESFSNHDPRAWLSQQTGYRSRANAAQANTFEALPFFYMAVLFACIQQVDIVVLELWMLAWLILRFAYIICYVKDWATIRSCVWIAALGVNVAMIWASIH